jgi:fucose permease
LAVTETRIDPNARPGFHRDTATWACYALLALLTSCYGMIGPLLPWLREALDLTYQQGAYHSVAMAVGVTGMGLMVPNFAPALGRRGCVAVCLSMMAAGLSLLCLAPALAVSLAASVIIGAALPFAVMVAPAVLTERHGIHTGIAMAEANAIAYLGFLFAPAMVSLAAAAGNWRWSFVLPAAFYALYWGLMRRFDFGAVRLKSADGVAAALPAAFWWHWLMLIFSISAELCMVVWGPSYLETVLGLPRAQALWAAMIFPLGMLLGRIMVSAALRRFRSEELALAAMLAGALGAMLFVGSGTLWVAAAGLFLSGVGMAGLYPFGITLAMQAAGPVMDRAAARASLASGLAILLAPFVIGTIADRAGMQAAFVLVPALLAVAGAAHLAGRRASRLS